MRFVSSMLLATVLLVASTFTAGASSGVQIGDTCGVNGADFLDATFAGEFRVAGETGCTIDLATGCFCAPKIGDEDQLGEWIWQCNSQSPSQDEQLVPFGPAPGKICPSEIPVPVGYEGDINPLCNFTQHPTGQEDDPPCGYSDCDQGGNFSAVCGCVDLAFGKGKEATDFQWYCLHASCHCGAAPSESSAMTFFGSFGWTILSVTPIATLIFYLM